MASVPPTHVICEGLGRALDRQAAFTIGAGSGSGDLALPEEFNLAGENCRIRLEHQAGQWWLFQQLTADPDAGRVVEAGDRLNLRCGTAETEVLFACCTETPGDRRPRG